MKTRFLSAALIGFAALLADCERQRRIVADYRLEQWEDFQTYYLHNRGHDDSAEGNTIIGGTVLRLGWSSRFVVAERHSIYRGDPDGWIIIDVQSGAMSRPFKDIGGRPEAQGIQIYDVGEAWKRL